jgi:hypothetical protein
MVALMAIRREMLTHYRVLDSWDISSTDSSTTENLYMTVSM